MLITAGRHPLLGKYKVSETREFRELPSTLSSVNPSAVKTISSTLLKRDVRALFKPRQTLLDRARIMFLWQLS
jgi:hypothetical protein